MVKNMTALMIASWQGNIQIVKDLIEVGADVNARLANGRTALILAIEQGQSQCAALLIKAGADVNITADINLSHSNCVKGIREGSDGNQMSSKQLGHSHHLQAKKEDEASRNGVKKATAPNPTPSIVIKRELQEILGNYGDSGDNDRHSDVRCNANSSPGKRSPIELPSASKVDNTSSSHLMKSTNLRKTPSPENRNENPIGRDFSSPRIAPSAVLSMAKTFEAAPTTFKTPTVTPEVQNSLTIPPVVRKTSPESSAVPKSQTVAKLLAGLAEKTPTVRKYPTIAPAMGHFSAMRKAAALMQAPAITPTVGQYPTVTPTIGQYPAVPPTIGQYPTVTPTIGQYPTVTPTIGQYATVTPTIGQATGGSSTVGKPQKVFIKILPAAGKTESVNQVVSSGVVLEAPPPVGKNPVGHPAVNTITAAVQGPVPAVVPAFWGAPAVTTTLAVTPGVKKNPTVTAALSKAPAIGKDTITIPLDFLGLCPSFENTPAVRKNPAVMQTAPAVVSAGTAAVFPSVQSTPAVVSAGTAAVFLAEAPSVQTTPAIVSAGAPAVFPPGTRTVVSAGAPVEASSVQTAPVIVSAGAPAVFPPRTREVVSARTHAETRAETPSVHTTPTIVSAAFVDELIRRNSISAESPRRSGTLNRSDSGDRHRRYRSRSRSDDSSVGDWLVHKKRRTASPVKVKEEPTGGDENDVDIKSETRGTDAATVDGSGDDNSDNHSSDSCPVKIKEEPGGSDEKYVDMSSKNNDKRIADSDGNNNDNVCNKDWVEIARVQIANTEDWIAQLWCKYQYSSPSISTSPSYVFGHGEKSSSDKSRRQHRENRRQFHYKWGRFLGFKYEEEEEEI